MRTRTTLCVLAAVLLTAPALAAEQDPGTPTRAYLFDEGVGPFTSPVGGVGAPGIISGHSWVSEGPFDYEGNHALDATGTGGGPVEFNEPYNLGSQATWSIWLKLNPGMGPGAGGDTIREIIMMSRPGSTPMLVRREKWLYEGSDGGKIRWYPEDLIHDDGAIPPYTGGYTGWHHLILAWNDVPDPNNSTFFVYWDGVRISGMIAPDNRDMASNPPGLTYATGVVLGTDLGASGGVPQWTGGLDEFGFWNRALSAGEALWLYNHSIKEIGVIPEPGALALLGLGALGLAPRLRRRKR